MGEFYADVVIIPRFVIMLGNRELPEYKDDNKDVGEFYRHKKAFVTSLYKKPVTNAF
jgi:hypothetical protein